MTQQVLEYDIVIVGAGVIGSALALHLSRLGYSIALLDIKQPSFEPTTPERVIALSEGSSRYLKFLGVWDDVVTPGVGLIKDIVVREPGSSGHVDMSHDEIAAAALGYVLEIRYVLQPLHQALEGKVDKLCPASCLAVESSDAGVSVTVKNDQGTGTIEAALLVGADGTNSAVRQLLGISTLGWDHNRIGMVATLDVENGHADKAYECFRQEGPLALLPLANNKFSLVWSVAPRHGVELLKLDDKSFLQAIKNELDEDVLTRIGSLTATSKREIFPLELRVARSFANQGVVLVGNAAHTIHPIAGQGMNLGFRDVVVLADVLGRKWARNNLTSPLITQTYAERRRLDMMAVAGFTEGVLETFSSSIAPLRWLRSRGLHAVQSTPFLKQMLLQQAAGLGQLKGEFDEY